MSDERSATPTDVKLGQRVRARRLEIGMSQERLAEAVGVTFQQVQKWERGVNRVACSRVVEISRALRLPIADLFVGLGFGEDESAEPSIASMMSTPEGSRMAAIFSRIKSAPIRRKVLSLTEAVVGE
jgi:transcriptional regulator with XRE-family HTH domain